LPASTGRRAPLSLFHRQRAPEDDAPSRTLDASQAGADGGEGRPKYRPRARPDRTLDRRVIAINNPTASTREKAGAATEAPPAPTRLRLGFLTRLEVGEDP